MSYIDYIRRFWREGKQYELTDSGVKLYFYLLEQFNLKRWPQVLEMSNAEIFDGANFRSKVTFGRCMNDIISAGLIYRIRGNVTQKKSLYSLSPFPENSHLDYGKKCTSNRGKKCTSSDSNSPTNWVKNCTSSDSNSPTNWVKNCTSSTFINNKDNKDIITTTINSAGVAVEKTEQKIEEFPHTQVLEKFFAPGNSEMINRLAYSLGMTTDQLRASAEEVVSEWQLKDEKHYTYSDAARHMVNHLRAKHRYTKQVQPPKTYTDPNDIDAIRRLYQDDTH